MLFVVDNCLTQHVITEVNRVEVPIRAGLDCNSALSLSLLLLCRRHPFGILARRALCTLAESMLVFFSMSADHKSNTGAALISKKKTSSLR